MLDAEAAQLRASASRVAGGFHAESPRILAGTSPRNVARCRFVNHASHPRGKEPCQDQHPTDCLLVTSPRPVRPRDRTSGLLRRSMVACISYGLSPLFTSRFTAGSSGFLKSARVSNTAAIIPTRLRLCLSNYRLLGAKIDCWAAIEPLCHPARLINWSSWGGGCICVGIRLGRAPRDTRIAA